MHFCFLNMLVFLKVTYFIVNVNIIYMWTKFQHKKHLNVIVPDCVKQKLKKNIFLKTLYVGTLFIADVTF